MDLTATIATEDHRPARDGTRLEIPRISHLGGVPDIDPAAIEHGALLALENLARHEDLAIDREGQILAALAHQRQRSPIAVVASGTGVLIVHRRHPPDATH